MGRLSNRLAKHDNGAALVEMALVLPLLMLLVFGIIDFGLCTKDRMAVSQAAREGARVAAVGGGTSAIKDSVVAGSPVLTISRSNITITTGAPSTDPKTWGALGDTTDALGKTVNNAVSGNMIRIQVTSTYTPITSLFWHVKPTLSGNSVMRRE